MLENPESHSTNGRLLYHEAKNYHLLGVWRKSIEGVIQFLERGAMPRRGVMFSMARLCRPSFSHSTDRRHKPTDPCGKKVYHMRQGSRAISHISGISPAKLHGIHFMVDYQYFEWSDQDMSELVGAKDRTRTHT